MDKTLISADNTWVLWAIITAWAATSIHLEQTYKWASRITGAICALTLPMILSNLRIIPLQSPVYDAIWQYIVPLAIPLLLYRCNIRKIGGAAGRLCIIFCVSAASTVVGAAIGYFLLKDIIPELDKVAAMMTGTYIGGTVNFAAMADSFSVPSELVSAAVVADNLIMCIVFMALIVIPSLTFFRKRFSHPHIDQVESQGVQVQTTLQAQYWQPKEISLKDIGYALGSSFVIVAISSEIARLLTAVFPPSENFLLNLLQSFLSNKYLIITTLVVLGASYLPQFFGSIRGSQEIGTFLIYLFFTVIGVPASITLIIFKSPLLLLFAAIISCVNILLTLTAARVMKFNLEDALLASNANLGGPTTAVALAISKGWTQLVGPIMLVGTLGYVLGNYLGIFMGTLLGG